MRIKRNSQEIYDILKTKNTIKSFSPQYYNGFSREADTDWNDLPNIVSLQTKKKFQQKLLNDI